MSFLAMDDPGHLRLRTLVSKGFTRAPDPRTEPLVLELTTGHLEAALEHESFDYITEFAGKLPMDVISELVGVPGGPSAPAGTGRRVMHREDGVTDVPAAIEASINLFVYYADMVAQRRKKPTDDLTSALIEAEIDGDRLGDDEIMAFLFLMVVAGNETTTKLFFRQRGLLGRSQPGSTGLGVRRPRTGSAVWVEETLRYDDTSSQTGPHRRRGTSSSRHHAARRRRVVAIPGRAPRRAGLRRSPTSSASDATSVRSL